MRPIRTLMIKFRYLGIRIYPFKKLMILLKIKYVTSILGFKYSTSSISGLLLMDEFAVKRIIRERKQIEKKEKLVSKRGKGRVMNPSHIQLIKDFVDYHKWKYFNWRMILDKVNRRVQRIERCINRNCSEIAEERFKAQLQKGL